MRKLIGKEGHCRVEGCIKLLERGSTCEDRAEPTSVVEKRVN